MKNRRTIKGTPASGYPVAPSTGTASGVVPSARGNSLHNRGRNEQKEEHETALQAIWSGTISFSLVAIPVQLVKAVEPGRVSFRMLHKKDYSPLLRRMFCPEEGKIVPPDEIIRGYEIGPDKYILITDEELESLSPERSRTIEIIEFIDMKDVDSIYYDHPYYLVPSKGGEKAYQLLVEVMDRTHKAGLAKFVLGEREYLVAVTSTQRALSLITLHYSEEILPDTVTPPEEEKTESKKKDLMKKIIKEMTGHFKPDIYADERRTKILKLLDKKVKKGATVEAPEGERKEGEGPVDLIKVLEESMRKVKKNR
jgi:DNA end-binding protein Ku